MFQGFKAGLEYQQRQRQVNSQAQSNNLAERRLQHDRENLRLLQKQRQDELFKLGITEDGGAYSVSNNSQFATMQRELAMRDKMIQSLSDSVVQNQVYSGINRYLTDYDANGFNRILNNNPLVAQKFRDRYGISRVSNLNLNDSEDRKLITGILKIKEDQLKDPKVLEEINKRFFAFDRSNPNGMASRELASIDDLIAETKYLNQVSQQEFDDYTRGFANYKAALSGTNNQLLEQDRENTALGHRIQAQSDAYSHEQEMTKLGIEAEQNRVEANIRLMETLNPELPESKAATEVLAMQRDIDKIFSDMGTDYETFINTDWSDPKNKDNLRQANTIAGIYEEQYGKLISPETKKRFSIFAKLASLGGDVAGLTSDETGIIDATYDNYKKYFTGTEKSKVAWSLFKSVSLQLLSGATVPDGEYKRFRESYGDLSEEQKSVMQKFLVHFGGFKDEFDALANMYDPMYTAVRLPGLKKIFNDNYNKLQETLAWMYNPEDTDLSSSNSDIIAAEAAAQSIEPSATAGPYNNSEFNNSTQQLDEIFNSLPAVEPSNISEPPKAPTIDDMNDTYGGA